MSGARDPDDLPPAEGMTLRIGGGTDGVLWAAVWLGFMAVYLATVLA
jgi:hypothetical protein